MQDENKSVDNSLLTTAIGAVKDAYCQRAPRVYYHPDSEQVLFVHDDELLAEHNYLSIHLQARFEALQQIEQLNQLSHQQRYLSHTHQQRLTQAYQQYYDCCDKLQQLLNPLPVPHSPTENKAAQAAKSPEDLPITFATTPIVELIEMRKGGGYKYTYVRSQKIKNHIRRYQLNTKERQTAQQSFIVKEEFVDPKTGKTRSRHKIDKDKLHKQLSELKLTSHADYELIKPRQKTLTQWADDLNKELKHSPYQGEQFSFDWKAQFMRWSYGASAQQSNNLGSLNVHSGKIQLDPALHASGSARLYSNLSLAEAKTEAKLHIPDRHGIRISYPSLAHNGELVPFGVLRFDLTLSLTGNVGASFALQADVNIDGNAIKGVMPKHRPDLKRLDRSQNVAEALKLIAYEALDVINNLTQAWREKEKRDRVMAKVLQSKGCCFKYCPPETKGAAVSALLQDHLWESLFPHTERKQAILHILRWAQSKQDFRNILQYLNQVPVNNKQDWHKNYQRIYQFLNDQEEVRELINPGETFHIVNTPTIHYRISHYSQVFEHLYQVLPDNTVKTKKNNFPNQSAPLYEYVTASFIVSDAEIVSDLLRR